MLTRETVDGPMELLVAEPSGPVRGGVVVIQEAFGLTDHIGRICERLAAVGWLAVAPALFHRTGSPVFGYGDLAEVAPHFLAIGADGLRTDVGIAIDVLAEAGVAPRHRGIIGFCMGGTVALWAATEFELGAAVSFYGGGVLDGRFGLPSLVELAPTLRAPWQGHYGDLDRSIPVVQVEALRVAADRAAVPTELYRHADAEHGFNCDDRDAFEPASAAAAWQRSLDWFDQHLA
jgi:carboxymethylenebutenolidase